MGCGLCEEMQQALDDFRARTPDVGLDYQLIDIDRDESLKARFNADVPVLSLNDVVVMKHFYDEDAIRKALDL